MKSKQRTKRVSGKRNNLEGVRTLAKPQKDAACVLIKKLIQVTVPNVCRCLLARCPTLEFSERGRRADGDKSRVMKVRGSRFAATTGWGSNTIVSAERTHIANTQETNYHAALI